MSEYLDEEEQLARAKSWWDENANSVIGGVVLVVGGIVGWNWFGDYSVTQKHDATRAYTAYVEAPDEAKEIQLETLSEDFGGSAVHLFALFDQASIAMNDGDPEKAKSLLETAVEVGSESNISQRSAKFALLSSPRKSCISGASFNSACVDSIFESKIRIGLVCSLRRLSSSSCSCNGVRYSPSAAR